MQRVHRFMKSLQGGPVADIGAGMVYFYHLFGVIRGYFLSRRGFGLAGAATRFGFGRGAGLFGGLTAAFTAVVRRGHGGKREYNRKNRDQDSLQVLLLGVLSFILR
jgi:hypothetical protein